MCHSTLSHFFFSFFLFHAALENDAVDDVEDESDYDDKKKRERKNIKIDPD